MIFQYSSTFKPEVLQIKTNDLLHLSVKEKYIELVKKVHLGFSIASYGKLQSDFLANSVVPGQAKRGKNRPGLNKIEKIYAIYVIIGD